MIDRPGQVWGADTTYVPLPSGLMYLVATIDWLSRRVARRRLSNAPGGRFRPAMPEESLMRGCPAIFDADQGVPFPATAGTSRPESVGVQVSMGGVGRCLDDILVEHLWGSVRCEELYPERHATVAESEAGWAAYPRFYNAVRPHRSLKYRTPASVHAGG